MAILDLPERYLDARGETIVAKMLLEDFDIDGLSHVGVEARFSPASPEFL